jgi:hypothetical protein
VIASKPNPGCETRGEKYSKVSKSMRINLRFRGWFSDIRHNK